MLNTLPNQLSVLRIVLSPIFFVLFISFDPILQQVALGVFAVAALTDWYDGVIARTQGTVTNLGKFLDPLADKVLTSAAFIAFAWTGMAEWWMVAVIIVRDIAVTVLRSLGETRGARIVTSRSAQWKTFIQMTVLYYLLLLSVLREVSWISPAMHLVLDQMLAHALVWTLMLVVTALTLFTGVQYVHDNRVFIRTLFGPTRRATS